MNVADGVARIHAVDANPRQSALLELKLAGIRGLEFDDFFRFFGEGFHPGAAGLYYGYMRPHLGEFARSYWDRHYRWFARGPGRDSFYFRTLSGRVARAVRAYLDLQPELRQAWDALFQARSLDEQRAAYGRSAHLVWTKAMNWAMSRQITMNLLGVPQMQAEEVKRQHHGGVAGFIRDSMDYVFRELPIWNNYFWRVYVYGGYTSECCPEYLKHANFETLKGGAAERIQCHTATIIQFLRRSGEPISRFVLLDHMDWIGAYHPQALEEEWEAIMERAAPHARIIFRSAHAEPAYLRLLRIPVRGLRRPVHEVLRFHPELARRLSLQDRVHTYAGFHIADVLG